MRAKSDSCSSVTRIPSEGSRNYPTVSPHADVVSANNAVCDSVVALGRAAVYRLQSDGPSLGLKGTVSRWLTTISKAFILLKPHLEVSRAFT
jgi:hypothetical protein